MSTTIDILDTTIPEPAWVLDPTYDSELNPDLTHSRPTAARMVSDEGKYVSRASDVERVQYGFDGDPGLLVEAAGRTNQVIDSADPSQWDTSAVSLVSTETSILKGETAYRYTNTGSNVNALKASAGSFTSNSEVVSLILEQGTDPQPRISTRDKTDNSYVVQVDVDWSDESIVDFKKVGASHFRLLESSGPNGNKIAVITVRYSGGTGGNSREVWVQPAYSSAGNNTIIHHAQIEEAPNASSPIVTQGSPVTRAGDEYAIPQGSWYNQNESTWVFEISLRYYAKEFTNTGALSISGASLIEVQGSSSPYNLGSFDGTNRTVTDVSYTPFNTITVAVSLTGSKIITSARGNSDTANHNGDLLSPTDIFPIGPGGEIESYKKILYFPRALSESTLNAITAQ